MAGVPDTPSFSIATADGVTTVFSFVFIVFSADDIKVFSVLNDVETEITSGITKAINSSFIGGTVTFSIAPDAALGKILIRREVAYEQTTEFADITRYKETAIEAALNNIVLQIQQLRSSITLSPMYSESASVTDLVIGTPIDGALLSFDGADGRISPILLSSVALSDLDTALTGLSDNDFLVYDGANFVNETPSEVRTTLGLVIDTDIQAFDDGLLSIAGLTTAPDKMIYTTGADTYSVSDLSAFARTILDDATALAVRQTLQMTGAVLQVQTTIKSDTFTTAASGWTDITGLSVAITPKETTSKIIIIGFVSATGNNATDNQVYLKILRGTTDLDLGGASGTRTPIMFGGDATSASQTPSIAMFAQDLPAVTSEVVYKVQGFPSNGGDVYVNRTENDTDTTTTARSISALMAIEIGI